MKRIIIGALITSLVASPAFATATKNKHHHKLTAKKTAASSTAAASSDNTETKKFTSSFDLTSNYVFRGVSQTTNLPAVQGGFTYTFNNGIYLNLWGSNVRFVGVGSNATVEFDYIAGITGTIKDLSYNLYYDQYSYPKGTMLNYGETILILNYSIFQGTFAYSLNEYDVHKPGNYVELGVNLPIPPKCFFHVEDINLYAGVGHFNLPKKAGHSYVDYLVTLSKKIEPYTISVSYATTNGQFNYRPFDRDLFFATVQVDV